MEKLKMESKNILSENIEKVAELFPNCLVETQEGKKIDFDILKQELSNDVIEGQRERYHLDFPGKREAIVEANKKTTKTLRPIKEKSVNFDTTKNIYIEGDNLEALKILQESYLGKIKCIYIDPPYNTGNDFVYNDDFSHKEKEELLKQGVTDEDGNMLTAKDINNESNAKYHSDWLKMMYPRIKLARNLLSDDAVIFISIDDNEVDNLRKLCDEVFGEKNYVATFVIDKTAQGANQSLTFKIQHEYLLMFKKQKDELINTNVEQVDNTKYKYKDDRGYYAITNSFDSINSPLVSNKNRGYTVYYNETNNDAKVIDEYDKNNNIFTDYNVELIQKGYVPIRPGIRNNVQYPWNWTSGRFLDEYKTELVFKKNKTGKMSIYHKNRDTGFVKDVTLKRFDTRGDGNRVLNDLLNAKVFDYPKSIEMLRWILTKILDKTYIILDFFSGSATTAHAVMKLNAEDGGNRQFIMVQLPEATKEDSEAYKAGFKNICDIGETRIRKAGEKILEEQKKTNGNYNTEKVEDNIIKPIDVGFRVYKIDDSNMKDVYYTPNSILQKDILDMVSNVKEDRTKEDLLIQVILDLGLTLDLPIEEKTIKGNKIFFVSENALVACFDKTVNIDILDEIAKIKPLKMCMRESSFAKDQDKINFFERLRKLSPDTEVKTI